ncbi:MAG: TonB family protein [Pseudomonadales bacterium]|nr:TonB family protein [Pseudomonadales bacterium]
MSLQSPAPNSWLRYSAALVCAAIISYGLFYFMHLLTSHGESVLVDRQHVTAIEFIRLKHKPPKPEIPQVKPQTPKPKDTPPPSPTPKKMAIQNPSLSMKAFAMPSLAPQMAIHGIGFNSAPGDGDAIPMVRVQPQYPFRAANQGIEGWVLVEFTITKLGTVKDVEVVESKPAYLFDRATIRAIKRWKFKPRTVNGEPIERHQVRQRIQFSLDKQK